MGSGVYDATDKVLSSGGGMDPAMMSALISGGSQVLSKAMAPSSAGPSRADSSLNNWQSFDNSGFTVAMGGSEATATRGLDLPWYVWAGGLVVAALWVKRRK